MAKIFEENASGWKITAHLPTEEIAVGKRIGIDYAGEDAEKPWRFWVKDNLFVSKK